MSKILIIDGQHTAYRAYYSMSRMSYKGQSTSITWGFLNILGGLLGKYKPERVYVAWDDGRHPERMRILPNYKNREAKLDFDAQDFHSQLSYLREMLNCLGLAQLYAPKTEADDYIYELTRRALNKTKHTVVIASGDKDFRQLVDKKVFIDDNKHGLITPLNFRKLFSIDPSQYADFLCLTGDDSDKIPGVPGIGEKTAIKILQEYEFVPNYLNTGIDRFVEKVREVYPTNRSLINLAYFQQHHGPIKLHYFKQERRPNKRIDEYKKICAKFGINKFITKEFLSQF